MKRDAPVAKMSCRPIYSITPIIAHLWWRRKLCLTNLLDDDPLDPASVWAFHSASGAGSVLARLAKLPGAEALSHFEEQIPPRPEMWSGHEFVLYKERLRDLYAAEIERVLTPAREVSDPRQILPLARQGHIVQVLEMGAQAATDHDDAGMVFWTLIYRILNTGNTDTIFQLLGTSPLGKYQVGKCATEMFQAGLERYFMTKPTEKIWYFETVENRARAAVTAWSLAAIKMHIYKDMRIYIAKCLWEMRHEWVY